MTIKTHLFVKAIIFILSVSIVWQIAPSYASSKEQSVKVEKKKTAQEKFIQNLGDTAIKILAGKKINKEKKSSLFRKLMRDSFDLKTIAKFVLSRNWRRASKEQRKEYLDLFEMLTVKTYSDRFALYTGEGFVVISSKKTGRRDFVVKSEITHPDGSPSTSVIWRVRNKNGKIGIIDVIVEGVSMSITGRQEYASIIQRNGGDIDALLDIMRNRAGLKKKEKKATS